MLKIVIQSFRMSLQNIKSNKMRSFLTMLGIVIGVAAVIGLITIMQGATNSVMSEFEKLGTGVLTVSAPGTALKKGLTDSDLEKLSQVEGVEAISPSVSVTTTAVYNGEVYKKISVSGESVVYFQHNDVINLGRAFNSSEESGDTNVCIVDKSFVQNVLNGQAALGSTVKLGGLSYTIIGIRKTDSSLTSAYSDTSNLDGEVIIPYRNALDMSKAANVSTVSVYVADGYSSSTVEKNLRSALDNFYNGTENAYSVINMESLMDSMSTIMNLMSALLGGIASIALVVGGIGIMNMMLVSVTERTKEIGLRKALGAEPVWIQLQFLMESITLSIVGGLIGIAAGLLIAVVASKLMNITFAISTGAILLGVGFSAAVGIIFGWAPARRASRLNPIDALRSE
jgi:putative ABC transport system permease protein